MMKRDEIYKKALSGAPVSFDEGVELYAMAPVDELIFIADRIRARIHPGNKVGWIIDRNVNITNICFSQCAFCNFCRKKDSEDAYVTTLEEYREKIEELFSLGGDQLLLQGGMNPDLGLAYYTELFKALKKMYPSLKLHALGPPEIVYLSKKERLPYREVLIRLISAGLDSLPGAGAEILSDRVRKILSPAKASTGEWLDVMKEAHLINLPTSATMMLGHIETEEERIKHLCLLREVQDLKPGNSYGFIAFIPWPFQDKDTPLFEKQGIRNSISGAGYLRLIAISRIMLNNIPNIQSSIITVGKEVAMLSLHAGANDIGSVMIEENVVSAAGATGRYNAEELQSIIRESGFTPRKRNQKYETII